MGKLKWIVWILLLVNSLSAELAESVKEDLNAITNDIRQLQFARRSLSLIKCNNLLAFADNESANIFKYRNEIFLTLFCNEPDLNDTLFFQMLYYLVNTAELMEVKSDIWKDKYKKERKKKVRIIIGTTIAILCTTAINITITRGIINNRNK